MSIAPHKIFKFKHRYLFTRSNMLRLRYVTSFAVFGVIAILSIFIPPSSSLALSSALTLPGEYADNSKNARNVALNTHATHTLQSRVSDAMRSAPDILKKAPENPVKTVSIGKGDTIAGVLQNAGLSGKEAYRAVKALSEHFEPRRVREGQELSLHFKPAADEQPESKPAFEKLSMKLSPVKEVVVAKQDDETFTAELNEKTLVKRTYGRLAKIETSLYGSAARADIPSPVIAEMIRIYSWDIDFQRDIRRGDKVEVLYEAYETEDGEFAKYGDILFASLSVGGSFIPVYRFEMDDGRVDYFEPDGKSVRKTLMKTPVDGARISSGFGMRHHPVLGYNKMHKGMDFAAPTGTPIYAAGDGVIEFMGRNGGYGNFIKIRHNGRLKTAYAHMHKFAKGMGKGKRVEQGEIIGYIGTTGRSTGPHLHYEVLVQNKQVNPRSLDLPTGEILEGQQLARFKKAINGLNQQYVSLTKGLKFASRSNPDNG